MEHEAMMELMKKLEMLKFHCGCIEVFDFAGPAPSLDEESEWLYVYSVVIPAYVKHLQKKLCSTLLNPESLRHPPISFW